MDTPRTALITGGTAGLGRALTHALVADGWTVVTDGRHADRAADLPDGVRFVAGDITDPEHTTALVEEVRDLGRSEERRVGKEGRHRREREASQENELHRRS